MLQNYIELILFISLACLGYLAGSWAERRHYRSIVEREQALLHIPVVTGEEEFIPEGASTLGLVCGSVVISSDYFKRILASLRGIVGGRVKSYESLLDRSRREAILRLKEQALQQGANLIVNLRLETSAIGNSANQKGHIGSVETLAYGTALFIRTV